MGDSVINILSYDPPTSTLYGLAANGRAYVASVDGGSTWVSVPYRPSSSLKFAKGIPWVKSDHLEPGATEPNILYTQNEWGGEYLLCTG